MLVLAQMIASGLTVSTECNVTVPCFFAVYEITIRRYEFWKQFFGGVDHVIDVFTSEDMEQLCIFRYLNKTVKIL